MNSIIIRSIGTSASSSSVSIISRIRSIIISRCVSSVDDKICSVYVIVVAVLVGALVLIWPWEAIVIEAVSTGLVVAVAFVAQE